ncbi:Transient receptor potential cation channel subfamily M member 4-like [Balamuthia mandrillaris]
MAEDREGWDISGEEEEEEEEGEEETEEETEEEEEEEETVEEEKGEERADKGKEKEKEKEKEKAEEELEYCYDEEEAYEDEGEEEETEKDSILFKLDNPNLSPSAIQLRLSQFHNSGSASASSSSTQKVITSESGLAEALLANQCLVLLLPDEALCYIMGFLDSKSLARLGCTCQLFRRLACTRSLWLKTSQPHRHFQFVARRFSLAELQREEENSESAPFRLGVVDTFVNNRYCFVSLSDQQTKLVEAMRASYFRMFTKTSEEQKRKNQYSSQTKSGHVQTTGIEALRSRPLAPSSPSPTTPQPRRQITKKKENSSPSSLSSSFTPSPNFPWPSATAKEQRLAVRYWALMVDIVSALLKHICKETGLSFESMLPLVLTLQKAEGEEGTGGIAKEALPSGNYRRSNHEDAHLLAFSKSGACTRPLKAKHWLTDALFLEGGLFQIVTVWNRSKENRTVGAEVMATSRASFGRAESSNYHIPLAEGSSRNEVAVLGGWMLRLIFSHLGYNVSLPHHLSFWINNDIATSKQKKKQTYEPGSVFISFSAQVSYRLLKHCVDQAVLQGIKQGTYKEPFSASSSASTTKPPPSMRLNTLSKQEIYAPAGFRRNWHAQRRVVKAQPVNKKKILLGAGIVAATPAALATAPIWVPIGAVLYFKLLK